MPDYKYVKRPNFVIKDTDGTMKELLCCCCGTVIAGKAPRVVGRRQTRDNRWIETVAIEFRRYSNYAEVKIQFLDGSYHVANGCRKCLTENMVPEKLHEIHMADMLHEDMQFPGREKMMERIPLSAVAVRSDGGGIE